MPVTGYAATSAELAGAPPIAAYGGFREEELGKPDARRRASAARAAVEANTPNFRTTVYPSMASSSSSATSAMVTAGSSGTSTSLGAASADPAMFTFLVHLFPFKVSAHAFSLTRCARVLINYSQHPADDKLASAWPSNIYREFAWSTDVYNNLFDRCVQFKLVFTVTLPLVGPVWEELSRQIVAHCTEADLELTGYDAHEEPRGPSKAPFVILYSNTKGPQTTKRFHMETGLGPETFTSKALLASKYTLPPYPWKGSWAKLPLIRVGMLCRASAIVFRSNNDHA